MYFINTAIEWTKEYITFFIDDKLFFDSYKGQDGRISTNEGWPFDKPYYLILNLAIGVVGVAKLMINFSK